MDTMNKKPQVNLLLVASDGGTDAYAIMDAWKQGQIPEVGKIILVSTHAGAGCLEKAAACGVEAITLIPPSIPLTVADYQRYSQTIWGVVAKHQIGLIFLVGCEVDPPLVPTFPMYKIHLAHPELRGGNGMYGLEPYEHILSAAVDVLKRWEGRLDRDGFFTYPTIQEVTSVPDDGPPLLQGSVEIPKELLQGILDNVLTLHDAAEQLQKLVLPYEWLMLPAAVRIAATMILRKVAPKE